MEVTKEAPLPEEFPEFAVLWTRPRDGAYRVQTMHDEAETVAPRFAPEAPVPISRLLPPPHDTEAIGGE